MASVAGYDKRPSVAEIEYALVSEIQTDKERARWTQIYRNPMLTLDTFKREAIEGLPNTGALLRSLYWRTSYAALPSPTSLDSPAWAMSLESTRTEWRQLRQRFLTSPDGRLVDAANAKGQFSKPGSVQINLSQNNPLSMDANNPWQIWFKDLEMRDEIRKDVLRTFPDFAYFRSEEVRLKMTNILHVWTKLNGDIGYRQGMHELLAPIFWMIDYDSLSSEQHSDSIMYQTLSSLHVEDDAYAVFSRLMIYAKTFYDSSPSIPISNRGHTPNLATRAKFPDPSTQSFKVVQPIIIQARRIQDTLLARVDPTLAAKLNELDIEPQLWAMRWLRLLFSREFPMQDTLTLWDAIFAEDSTLKVVDWICVAMLLRVSAEIMEGGYSEALQLLLRYPKPADGDYRISVLFQQAVRLRDSPSMETAAEINLQNIELGLSIRPGASRPSEPTNSHPTQSGARPQRIVEGREYVEDLAKNVYERAEALGINKALLGTFGELKKYGQQALQSPIAATMSTQKSDDGFPSGVSTLPFRTAQESQRIERENALLRRSNTNCAEAVAFCAEQMTKDAGNNTALLPLLKHVQDVLQGRATFDPQVMVNVKQILKMNRAKTETPSASTVSSPIPASTSESSRVNTIDIINQSTGLPSYLNTTLFDQPATSLPRIPMHTSTQSAYAQPSKRHSVSNPSQTNQIGALSVPAMTSRYKHIGRPPAVDPLGVNWSGT